MVGSPTFGKASLVGGPGTSIGGSTGSTSVATPAVRPCGTVAYASWMNTANLTLEAVYKPANVSESHVLGGRWDFTTAGEAVLILFTDNAAMVVRAIVGGTERTLSVPAMVTVGVTAHWAAVFNGTDLILYRNGTQVGILPRPGHSTSPPPVCSASGAAPTSGHVMTATSSPVTSTT